MKIKLLVKKLQYVKTKIMNEILYKNKLYKITKTENKTYTIEREMLNKNREIIEIPIDRTIKYEILKVK